MTALCHFHLYFGLTASRTHYISEFGHLNISTFIMASQAPNNAVEEDYQLWDPREREDTRLGKKFVVRSSKQIIYIERMSVRRSCVNFSMSGLH